MRPTDIVGGVLAMIFLSMALGQYGRLERFARIEATKALRPKLVLTFFPTAMAADSNQPICLT